MRQKKKTPAKNDLIGTGSGDLAGIAGAIPRFGVEVQDRYLVIKNLPLTTPLEVVGRRDLGGRTAHLRLDPAACEEQLPARFQGWRCDCVGMYAARPVDTGKGITATA